MNAKQTTNTALMLSAVVLSVLLSACGFQLRGNVSLPAGVEPLFISTNDPNGELAIALRNLLNSNDVELTQHASAANHQITIVSRNRDQRSLSIGAGATVAEFQVTETVNFELRDSQGAIVFGPRELSERRILRNDPNNAISTAEESNIVRSEMMASLAAKIARQVALFNYRDDSKDKAGDDSEHKQDSDAGQFDDSHDG